MPVKIGKDIVIYDDKVFKIGYGDPAVPENGMIRYDPVAHDFEFHIKNRWVKSGINIHSLHERIRYNEDIDDFEFLLDSSGWVKRCDCSCPDPEPCPPCPDPEPCPEPDPCPPCPDLLHGPPNMTRQYRMCCTGKWNPYVQGGPGMTVDLWDMSLITLGAIIDFKFETYILPDRFLIEYPVGTLIYDSGWRSTNPEHEIIDHSQYPSGILTPGSEQIYGLLNKGSQSTVKVTTHGAVGDGTEWRYSFGCRTLDGEYPYSDCF